MTRNNTNNKISHVVIIDDDDVSNFIYTRILQASEVAEKITCFQSGQEALDFLNDVMKNSPDQFPDIIFLDINMPVMNGWDFLEEFRENVGNKKPKEVVICMLSSSVYQEDIDKAYSYNEVDEYISKPLTQPIIENLVAKHFGG